MFDQLMSSTALPNLHPAFIHFPVALLITAVALDLVVVLFRRLTWLDRTAALLYVLGAIGSLAAYFSGRSAADSMRGLSGPAQAAMWDHGDWALYTTAAFVVIAVLRGVVAWRESKSDRIRIGPLRAIVLIAALLGQGLVFETADRGGALVFRHSIAVTTNTGGDTTQHVSSR
ncbi:MAG: hypothetical protein HY825_13945 [Acidobacteria bacterium]|nr:hypothetical protein [Acidobacteriota bacterium]